MFAFGSGLGAAAAYRPPFITACSARPAVPGRRADASQPASTTPASLLPLPLLHAQLLPLALAAGHEQLVLSCHYQGTADNACYYEADALGGVSGFRRYISWLDKDGGDRPEQFEYVLRRKLEQQISLRSLSQPTTFPAA